MRCLVISGSRADRGPLTPVAASLGAEWLSLDIPPSRSGFDSANSCSQAMIQAADCIDGMKPDLVVLLGDRYEILGAASAAYLQGVPIAHLSGGDITEGSQDDAMRHAITKMAHLHFPTHEQAAERIIAVGEEPWRVYNVGCPGIDHILSLKLYSHAQTLEKLGVVNPYLLVAYQPATLAADPLAEADQLLAGLSRLPLPCVFTTLNGDAWGRQIEAKFRRFCSGGRGVVKEMDNRLYLSAMVYSLLLVGNSSSGLYEAPTMGKKFVNVGDRQRGRPAARSVLPAEPVADKIQLAIQNAIRLRNVDYTNPYGDGHAAARIKGVLDGLNVSRSNLLTKRWRTGWPLTGSGNRSTLPIDGEPTPKKSSSDMFVGNFQPGPAVPGYSIWDAGKGLLRGF